MEGASSRVSTPRVPTPAPVPLATSSALTARSATVSVYIHHLPLVVSQTLPINVTVFLWLLEPRSSVYIIDISLQECKVYVIRKKSMSFHKQHF